MLKLLVALAALVLVSGCDYRIIQTAPNDKIVHFMKSDTLAQLCALPDDTACNAYILGAADALDAASMYWPSVRCRPGDVNAAEFAKIVKQWIKDHADDTWQDGESTPAASQIVQVTRVTWPCPGTEHMYDEEGLRADRPN